MRPDAPTGPRSGSSFATLHRRPRPPGAAVESFTGRHSAIASTRHLQNIPNTHTELRGRRTMANFSAADVKRLRELTSAGMMDCKKALDEADGDFDKAVELLRVKGAAKAAARGAERETSAGLVASSGNAIVSLKSETDFVAKNADFINTAQRIADAANEAKAADIEALKAVPLDGKTVGELVEQLAKLGRAPCRAREWKCV